MVAGLGFAAVRDFASYVKHSPGAIVPAQRVIGEGISQDGRFLRDMLYQGFNADEQGRIALDGVLAHVGGAGRGSFNVRFAQPSRDAEPTSSIYFPTDLFPFTDLPEVDPGTGQRDGLLLRATAEGVVPRIFLSNTSHEYWGRVASLITTSPDGKHDVELSSSVRVYHFTGLQHFSGDWPPAKGSGDLLGQQPQSPLPVRYFWRAMIANMDAWLRGTAAPPASRYPRIDNATLVPIERYAFPAIPGVNVAHDPSQAWHLDFGPQWQQGIEDLQPPRVGQPFPVLVPQVDQDGNELGGIRLPEFAAPLATYTPWNLRDPSIGAAHQRVAFEGSFLPFARDQATRARLGDPRASIAERYSDKADYLKRYTRALDALIRERYLLPEDRDALLHAGSDEWDYAARLAALLSAAGQRARRRQHCYGLLVAKARVVARQHRVPEHHADPARPAVIAAGKINGLLVDHLTGMAIADLNGQTRSSRSSWLGAPLRSSPGRRPAAARCRPRSRRSRAGFFRSPVSRRTC